ncbi:MAG: hypothetical protein KDH96_13605 [Candidatus Riesia sp.]|nr:hypothetical protein [Candidatus Riesia sp.]
MTEKKLREFDWDFSDKIKKWSIELDDYDGEVIEYDVEECDLKDLNGKYVYKGVEYHVEYVENFEWKVSVGHWDFLYVAPDGGKCCGVGCLYNLCGNITVEFLEFVYKFFFTVQDHEACLIYNYGGSVLPAQSPDGCGYLMLTTTIDYQGNIPKALEKFGAKCYTTFVNPNTNTRIKCWSYHA